MRDRLPFASARWQPEHLAITSLFVTGIPSSEGGFGVFGASAALAIDAANRRGSVSRTRKRRELERVMAFCRNRRSK